jgi:hypothetical protein
MAATTLIKFTRGTGLPAIERLSNFVDYRPERVTGQTGLPAREDYRPERVTGQTGLPAREGYRPDGITGQRGLPAREGYRLYGWQGEGESRKS